MPREFLPGNCNSPENNEVFLDADRGLGAAAKVAKRICESCVQRQHCIDQSNGIAIEIAKATADIDSVVIGGQDVPMEDAHISLAGQSALERLREPALEFDIKNLPDNFSPRQTLDAIRQAMRARQIRVEGRPPNHKDQLEASLRGESLLDNIDTNTIDSVTEAGAAIILRHRAFGLTQHRKAKPLTEAELEQAHAIFREFTVDTIALLSLGAKPRFAQYHSPDLYPRLIDEASRNNILTPSIIRDLMRQYATDPVGILDQRFKASKSVKKSSEAKTSPSETKRYERELSQRHSDAKNAVKRLRSNFDRLVQQFPDIDRRACAAIAHYHPDNPVAAAEIYTEAYAECLALSAESPFLTPHIISEAIVKDPANGVESVQQINDRAYSYYIYTDDERIRRDPTFLGYTALAVKRELNPDELTKRYLARRATHKSSTKHPLLTKQVAVSIAETIPDKEHQKRAMLHASNLIRRELLIVTDDCLQWTPDADYLTRAEKQAVLAVLGLDVVIDGQAYDQQALCDVLSVKNLSDIVNRVLVPQILPVERPRENLLEHARYRRANKLDSTTWARQQQIAERIRQKHDFGEDHYRSQAAYVHNAFKNFIVQIVDAFPGKLPRVSAIQAATDEFFIDFKQLYTMATHLGTEDHEALKKYVGDIPDFSHLIFVYAARYDHSIPLRFIRALPEKRKIMDEYSDKVRLTKTTRTQLATAPPEKIRQRLDDIVRLTEQHKTNPWITKAQIQAISADSRDPEANVSAFIHACREIVFAYPDFFDRDDIGPFVMGYKNPIDKAAQIVQKIIALEKQYTGPEFNRFVFFKAATQKEPDEWLEQYRRRFHTASKLASPRANDYTIKRFAAIHKKPSVLANMIQVYNALLYEFEFDDQVARWMIDDAMRHTSAGVRKRIYYMRFLRASGIALRRLSDGYDDDYSASTETLDQIVQHQSSEDAYLHSQDQQEKRGEILTLLNHLETIDQAAILMAYEIDIPLPAELSDEQVLKAFDVKNADELISVVNTIILPKIKGA